MAIDTIEVGSAVRGGLKITLRGKATEVIQVLVNGLPREALEQLRDGMSDALAKRSDEASGVAK